MATDGILNVDQWNGYRHDRARLLNFLQDHHISDTVFVTGDIHSAWAFDVPLNQDDHLTENIVASEFVSPSITSDSFWDGFRTKVAHASGLATAGMKATRGAFYSANDHLKFTDLTYHGFGILDIKPEGIEHTWHFIDNREFIDTDISWTKKARLTAGKPGLTME